MYSQTTFTNQFSLRLRANHGALGPWDACIAALIFAGIVGISIAAVFGGAFDPIIEAAGRGDWGEALIRPSVLWAITGLVLLTLRTALWFGYEEVPASSPESAPSLTVVIPAFNEGAMVEKTIVSVLSADYPRDRLEVVVIDDGSRDDTWMHIERAAARYPGIVTCVRFPENRGKREALAEGFRRGRGSVFVTIDSDSVIESGALLAMVAPFADPRVGAVAGKVAVYNRLSGLLPRMLHVRFALSFDFLRSVQSTYGTVYCCPGALSAYRATAVKAVLTRWLNQQFLGASCTIGEDRALTNEVLRLGLDTVYQRSAVVHTIVPSSYRTLCKMYLRWNRSYVREELRFLRIVWSRPLVPCMAAVLEKTVTNLRYPVAFVTMGLVVGIALDDPMTVVRLMVAIGVTSAFYMLYFLRSERSFEFVYGIVYAYFSFFALWWILPYAVLTARARGWLTR